MIIPEDENLPSEITNPIGYWGAPQNGQTLVLGSKVLPQEKQKLNLPVSGCASSLKGLSSPCANSDPIPSRFGSEPILQVPEVSRFRVASCISSIRLLS